MIRHLCLMCDSYVLLHTFFCVIFHTSFSSRITGANWLIFSLESLAPCQFSVQSLP